MSAAYFNFGYPEIGPTEIRFHGAMIVTKEGSMVATGREVGGAVTSCDFYRVGTYTPPLFRRPRLKRLGPLASRVHAARRFWEWSGEPIRYVPTEGKHATEG